MTVTGVPATPEGIIDQLVTDAGASDRKLAGKTRVSGHVRRNHLSNIYAKLGVMRRLALSLWGTRTAMVPQSAVWAEAVHRSSPWRTTSMRAGQVAGGRNR